MWRSDATNLGKRLRDRGRPVTIPDRDHPDAYLPTPEEIARAAAKIRAGWPPGEAHRRYVGGRVPNLIRLPPAHFRKGTFTNNQQQMRHGVDGFSWMDVERIA